MPDKGEGFFLMPVRCGVKGRRLTAGEAALV